MKKVQLIIALFISAAVIFSCKDKDSKPETRPVEKPKVEKKEMSFEEVSKILGNEIASKLVSNDEASRGKPVKTVIVVWFNDLVLTPIAGGYNTTLPANVTWSGVQKLAPPIQSLCNWYLVGSGLTNKDCITDSSGSIRGWATDTDYNVHVSNVIN